MPYPRFVTDEEMRARFGLTETALRRLRATRDFPRKDGLVNKTDSKAVEIYFDRRLGIRFSPASAGNPAGPEWEEDFSCLEN